MSWKKKIEKSVGDDLQPGEQVVDGMFMNPAGHTIKLAARGAGGLVGAAIANRVMKDGPVNSGAGSAVDLPNEPVILGLTDRRLLVWGTSALTGRPKGLKAAFDLSAVSGMEARVNKASVAVNIMFADGTGIIREAPRISNDAEAFAKHLNAALTTAR